MAPAFIGKFAWNEFCHFWDYEKSIENLRTQLQTLEAMKIGVQESVDVARRSGEVIRYDVEQWLTNLIGETGMISETEMFLENAPVGRSFFNAWSCYNLSKDAKTRTEAVTGLQGQGRFTTFSFHPPPPSIEFMLDGDFVSSQSTTLAFDEVVKALKDDHVNTIGIYGIGGVGKTTLVEKIGIQVKRDDYEVLKVVVSATPNIRQIQSQIAENIGLKLTEDTEHVRKGRLLDELNKHLKEKRVLVILDDVWKTLQLADVGIPINNASLKIILTTRLEQMCTTMNCQRKIELDVLSEQDSWNLFKHKAGDVIESPTLYDEAKKVVAECGGLPLALVTVGSALRNEDRLQEWKQTSDELRIGLPTIIHDMEPRVYASLRLSYNRLPSKEAKQMFLLCCLFPEDYDIDMETLVVYGVGICLFQGVIRNTMEEARNRARAVINILKASSLLLKSDKRDHIKVKAFSLLLKDDKRDHMKVHDLVRDVGILISSEDNTSMVRASVGLERWPTWERCEHCTSISLMFNDIQVLNDKLSCPNLKILLLQGNNLSEISDAFFVGMESLEVLDLSDTNISALPSSIKRLTKLRTVRAQYMRYLDDISLFGEMNDLEILDLRDSHLLQYPTENRRFLQFPKTEKGQSRNLRVLNLNNCSFADDGMLSDFISSLTKLEELYILGNYRSDKAKEIEWKSLPHLTTLCMETKNVELLPEDLWARLKSFCISEDIDKHGFVPRADTCLSLSGNRCFEGGILMSLKKTRHLKFHNSVCSRNVLLKLDELGDSLQLLQYLEVSDCDGIEYVITVTGLIDLPNLESLEIGFMEDLKEICHGLHLHTRCSWKLTSLWVDFCHGLLTIVPFNLLTKLLNLECLAVESCVGVKAIFDLNHEGDSFLCLLSTLTELMLYGLPNLEKIWKGPTRLVCLRNLKHIHVSGCEELMEIFSPTLSQTLLQLEDLIIEGCDELEEVVTGQENDATIVEIVFPKLQSITLFDLRNLKCFCSGTFSFQFPALENLNVHHCYKMQAFTLGPLSTPKLKTIKLHPKESSQTLWRGNVNDTIHHLYDWVFSWREDKEKMKVLPFRKHSSEASSSVP